MRVRCLVCAFALVACGGSNPRQARTPLWGAVRSEWGSPQPGDRAPDLDLPRTLEKGSTSLASLRGSWVLLHFTATWCPFCDAEIASLEKLANTYANRNVRVVLVGVEEPLSRWEPYAREHVHAPLIALHDLDGRTTARFAPPGLQPSFDDRAEAVLAGSLIIDPQGVIRLFVIADSVHFDPTLADVRGELDRLLAGDKSVTAGAASVDDGLVVRTDAPMVTAKRGSPGELAITIDIAGGWHVMSNHPSKPEYIATTLELAADGITFGEPIYPSPVRFDVGDSAISTFEGRVLVRVPFEVKSNTSPGRHAAGARLRYQACTRASCRFPRNETFEATIDVE